MNGNFTKLAQLINVDIGELFIGYLTTHAQFIQQGINIYGVDLRVLTYVTYREIVLEIYDCFKRI